MFDDYKIKSENDRYLDGSWPDMYFYVKIKFVSRTENKRSLPDILKSKAQIDWAIEAEIEILICTYIFNSNVLSISFDDFLTKFECWFFFFIIFLLLLKTVKTLFLLVRKKHFELQNLFSFSVLKSPSPTFTSLNLSCFALDIYFFNFLGNNTQARENSTQILYGKRNYDNWQGQSSQGFARSGSQKATSTPFKL